MRKVKQNVKQSVRWTGQETGKLVNLASKVAPLERLERSTSGLGNRCSIHLSYRGMMLNLELLVLLCLLLALIWH